MNKIKCLIIEDDSIKLKKVKKYLSMKHNIGIVFHKSSFQSALQDIMKNEYDMIIIDMSIPLYDSSNSLDSGKPKNFGGRDILKEMKRYKRNAYSIVLTQYDNFDGLITLEDLDKELRSNYSNNYKGCVFYSNEDNKWQEELNKHIEVCAK